MMDAHVVEGTSVGTAEAGLSARENALIRFATLTYLENRTILWLSLGYIAFGGVLLTLLERPWPLSIVNRTFHTVWLTCSAVWLVWQYLRNPKLFRAALAPTRVLGAVLVALLIVPAQITFQALKQSIGPVIGFNADPWLHHLDVLVHGQMAWRWLEPVLAHGMAVKALDVLYVGWFSCLTAFCLWASWTRHREHRQRALIAFLLVWIGAGTVAAGMAASVGPCFYGKIVSGSDPYSPLMTRLDSINANGAPLAARTSQQRLWKVRQADQWKTFGGISAMPSLHVGIAVLFALVAWPLSRMWGGLLTLYALCIQVGSVALGWHYAIDGYIGGAFAVLAWASAGALARWDQRAVAAHAGVRRLEWLRASV